jgi:hypothetical protein
MQQHTKQVPNEKHSFFIARLMNLALAKDTNVAKEPSKEQILDGIKNAVQEIKQIKAGKLDPVLFKDFLIEL